MNRLFISLAVLSVGMAQAEPRTFTSPDGRTIQGEISSATPDRVTLKLVNGQTIVAEVGRFVQADQDHIAAWRKANPVQTKYRFTADYTKSKSSSSKQNAGSETITTEMWDCNMKLVNQSGQTLEGVTVEYVIYLDRFSQGNKIITSQTGKADIGTMKHLQQLVVKTDAVRLMGYELQGGYYYPDGTRPRGKEGIRGMTINIKHAGNVVFGWSSNNVPKGGATAEGTTGSLLGK